MIQECCLKEMLSDLYDFSLHMKRLAHSERCYVVFPRFPSLFWEGIEREVKFDLQSVSSFFF